MRSNFEKASFASGWNSSLTVESAVSRGYSGSVWGSSSFDEGSTSSSLTMSCILFRRRELALNLSFWPRTLCETSPKSLKMSRLSNIVSSLYLRLCSTRSRMLIFKLESLSSNFFLNLTVLTREPNLLEPLRQPLGYSCLYCSSIEFQSSTSLYSGDGNWSTTVVTTPSVCASMSYSINS